MTGKPLYPVKEKETEAGSALDFSPEGDEPPGDDTPQTPPASPSAPPPAPVAETRPQTPPTPEPKKVEPSTTTLLGAQSTIVTEGRNVPEVHPLVTPMVQTKLGSYPAEHGFVTVCKGCNREEIFRTNNASKVPGRCGNCGAALVLAGEVA